ncbi:MAG TPA: Hsp33 family molecular chaperone HslO [Oceanipulchritudo sp.]|nr:Hsp33 family molecular chaperone HslO [Oceanipulchritudo sp.]
MAPASQPSPLTGPGHRIENRFVRGRNVLLASADFSGLFADTREHFDNYGFELPADIFGLFTEFLAGFTLHAASHPRNEVLAWTVHFQDPPLNIFLAGDTELSTVAGRIFTEGLREEPCNMFYQDLVVRGKPPHRSIVPFEGTSARGSIEFFYSQSEQRPGRFFHLGGQQYALASAHPDYDRAWFRNLTAEALPDLDSREILSLIETRDFRWYCGCHYQKILEVLSGPMRDDPGALFGDEEAITVNCPRCAARYRVSREAMEACLRDAGRGHP